MSKKINKVIEGSGFLAKNFEKYSTFLKKKNVIIYAAGVSNSLSTNKLLFKKELNRFENFCKSNKKKLIYISTTSIYDNSRNKSKYIKNKIKIEKIIKKKVKNYLIMRLPEIVGHSKNPNTLVNFFYKRIKYKKKFFLYSKTKRNLLDVDDAIKICVYFISINNKNQTINILNKYFYRPIEIVKEIEKILKKLNNYKIIKKNSFNWYAKNSITLKVERKNNLKFGKYYLQKILKKYYK